MLPPFAPIQEINTPYSDTLYTLEDAPSQHEVTSLHPVDIRVTQSFIHRIITCVSHDVPAHRCKNRHIQPYAGPTICHAPRWREAQRVAYTAHVVTWDAPRSTPPKYPYSSPLPWGGGLVQRMRTGRARWIMPMLSPFDWVS